MQPARTTSPTSKGKRPDTPNLNTNTTERVDTPQTAITPYTALFDRTNSQSLDTPASTAPPSAVEDMEKRLRFAALPNDSTDERVKANARDLQSTQALVGTVQNLLRTLAPRVQRQAESLPAIKAQQSIAALVKSWDEQLSRQTKEMENMQKRIDAALTKDGVLAKLDGDMRKRIEEKVKQQVAKKVKEQMSENISDTLRKGVDDYKRQIAEVEQGLHNADARRQNSLLGSSGRKLGEMKLQPVYPEAWANKETPPTIPAEFPATLNALWSMPLADLTRLMATGYGISVKDVAARRKKGRPQGEGNGAESPQTPTTKGPGGKAKAAAAADAQKERMRAAMIAFFMQHIGVPFSATSTTSDTQPGRIVITRQRRC